MKTRLLGKKANPTEDKIVLGATVHATAEDLLAHVHQGREVVKKTKKIKGMANKISSLIPGDFVVTTTTDVVDHKTLNQKMARRPRHPKHQLRTSLLQRPSRAMLSNNSSASLPSTNFVIKRKTIKVKFQQ